MNDEIIRLCKSYGIDRKGLTSIRNFIDAASYHSRLEGNLLADHHVLWNTAIRRATNRISCQGRHGNSCAMSRRLSKGALLLRDSIRADSDGRKLPRWLALVTDEHQEPVRAVEDWIKSRPEFTVDDVVLRILQYPSVVVTKEEERRIPSAMRHSGSPGDRYQKAGIEVIDVAQSAAEVFGLRPRPGSYYEERLDFE